MDDKEKWFMALPYDQYIELTTKWNSQYAKTDLPNFGSYDEALNYFKKIPFDSLGKIAKVAPTTMPTEAFSALLLWREIVASPAKIAKFHKSGLTSSSNEKSIVEIAEGNDLLATLKAIRRKVAERIDAGSDDMARLTQQLRDITHQIAEEERKLGPNEDTELGKLIGDFKKRSGYNGKGARSNSFKSRTIEDVE